MFRYFFAFLRSLGRSGLRSGSSLSRGLGALLFDRGGFSRNGAFSAFSRSFGRRSFCSFEISHVLTLEVDVAFEARETFFSSFESLIGVAATF